MHVPKFTKHPLGHYDFGHIGWQYDDGGREAAGFKGSAGDCVTRAIAIAAGMPYLDVYGALHSLIQGTRLHRKKKRGASPRDGVPMLICRRYLEKLGWAWTPTMGIGTGCKVHLRAAELPAGRLIVSVSKHLLAVVDGVMLDTDDPSRGGTRCVYGYWRAQ